MEKAERYGDRNLVLLGTSLVHRKNGFQRRHRATSGTYSFCYPYNYAFMMNGKVVYEWDKDIETRKEFFFGEQKRTYEGDQFCFLEYCQIALDNNRFPTKEDIKGKLEESIAQMYDDFLRRIVQLAKH